MNIVVCIKQVPDTAHLKFDSADQLAKDGQENIINPFCEYAVEVAIRLKEANEGSKVTAVTIGPAGAKEALKRALAMGCDEAVLISDDKFNGADSWATAYTLSEAIKKQVPDVDVMFFGQLASDDMAGITGPAFAQFMELPSITFGKNVEAKDPKTLTVYRETEKGVETLEMSLPGVVSIMKADYEPRIPSIKGVMKANRTDIPVLDAAVLGVADDHIGENGSPTRVLETWRRPKKQGGQKIDGADPQVAVSQLVGFLKEQKVI